MRPRRACRPGAFPGRSGSQQHLVMLTPDRFEYDERCLADRRPLRRAALSRHQALYVNHLRIAQHLETWARGMDAAQGTLVRDARDQGFAAGLRAVATYLR